MSVKSRYPQSFEKLGQVCNFLRRTCECVSWQPMYFKGYGFLMYSAMLPGPDVDGSVLSIPGIRDRAYVHIGNVSLFVFDILFRPL